LLVYWPLPWSCLRKLTAVVDMAFMAAMVVVDMVATALAKTMAAIMVLTLMVMVVMAIATITVVLTING
jgi:hypothetical protein